MKTRKNIRLSKPAESQLQKLAEATGRNQTEVVHDAIALLYMTQGAQVGAVLEVAVSAPHDVLREVADYINEGEAFDSVVEEAVIFQTMPSVNGLIFAIAIDPAVLESETRKFVEWWQRPDPDESD